ncbi:MAG: hypothetical protein ACRC33_22850 [Gemmataceae bacterium]
MRADMAKVLVERPRIGGTAKPRKGYTNALLRGLSAEDGLPSREGIKAAHSHRKHFNEHLGPLRRFLDSQAGRQWDKVYAEIAGHVDGGNVVQKHILTHLFQYVEVNAVLVGGVPHHPPHVRRWGGGAIAGRHAWYVCPRSGLLRRAPLVRPAVGPAAPVRHWLNAEQFAERRPDGRWVRVTVRRLQEPPWGGTVRDEFRGRDVGQQDVARQVQAYGKPVYAVSVEPVGRAELRRLPIPIDLLRPPVQNVVRG